MSVIAASFRTAKGAREAAERANRAKSRFLANRQSDLRQPYKPSRTHGAMRRMISD